MCQLRRHIARSVVKARPVGIAAIIGITMLPGRFGIGRAAAAELRMALGRDRLGREVDNAAAEFTRKVGGKTDSKSTRRDHSHHCAYRMPSYACKKKNTQPRNSVPD